MMVLPASQPIGTTALLARPLPSKLVAYNLRFLLDQAAKGGQRYGFFDPASIKMRRDWKAPRDFRGQAAPAHGRGERAMNRGPAMTSPKRKKGKGKNRPAPFSRREELAEGTLYIGVRKSPRNSRAGPGQVDERDKHPGQAAGLAGALNFLEPLAHFSSSTTTETGGIFTVSTPFFSTAPLKTTGFTFSGWSKVLQS